MRDISPPTSYDVNVFLLIKVRLNIYPLTFMRLSVIELIIHVLNVFGGYVNIMGVVCPRHEVARVKH